MGMRAAPAQAPGPVSKKLKKGDLLFAEGENSRAMYFIKSGMIRIFKKKGESAIEIDTIHSGQIVGELAFLDGNPRSASAEALTDVEMMEISSSTFTTTMASIPDWLKLLLKTVVGRLRTASTRIRQLETASTAVDYSSKDGKRSQHYVFMSPHEVLKVASAILLVGARSRDAAASKEIPIKVALVNKYANQIMNVPVAKITALLDVLSQAGLLKINDTASECSILDIDLLERYIFFLSEENLLEPSKRHDLSLKGYAVMSYMAKHIAKFPPDAEGSAKVNLALILKTELEAVKKEVFRLDDFQELPKVGYASQLNVVSTEEVLTTVKLDEFLRAFKMQRIQKLLEAANEQKGGRAK